MEKQINLEDYCLSNKSVSEQIETINLFIEKIDKAKNDELLKVENKESNKINLTTDTHGDLLSLMGSLASCGVEFKKNNFLFYSKEDKKYYYRNSKNKFFEYDPYEKEEDRISKNEVQINVDESLNNFVVVPFGGTSNASTLYHLGDVIDRGTESLTSILLCETCPTIKIGQGNHEFGYKQCSKETLTSELPHINNALAKMEHKGKISTVAGYVGSDDDIVVFSHTALTKQHTCCLFNFLYQLYINNKYNDKINFRTSLYKEFNKDIKYKKLFSKVITFLEKYGKYIDTNKPEIYNDYFNKTIRKNGNFTFEELVLLKDIIGNTLVKQNINENGEIAEGRDLESDVLIDDSKNYTFEELTVYNSSRGGNISIFNYDDSYFVNKSKSCNGIICSHFVGHSVFNNLIEFEAKDETNKTIRRLICLDNGRSSGCTIKNNGKVKPTYTTTINYDINNGTVDYSGCEIKRLENFKINEDENFIKREEKYENTNFRSIFLEFGKGGLGGLKKYNELKIDNHSIKNNSPKQNLEDYSNIKINNSSYDQDIEKIKLTLINGDYETITKILNSNINKIKNEDKTVLFKLILLNNKIEKNKILDILNIIYKNAEDFKEETAIKLLTYFLTSNEKYLANAILEIYKKNSKKLNLRLEEINTSFIANNRSTIKYLFENEQIDIEDKLKDNLLMNVCYLYKGDDILDLVKYLENKGANIHTIDKSSNRNLININTENSKPNKDLIEYLIKKGVNADQADSQGKTPLLNLTNVSNPDFIIYNNFDISKLLVKNGADINYEISINNTIKTSTFFIFFCTCLISNSPKNELKQFFLQIAKTNIEQNKNNPIYIKNIYDIYNKESQYYYTINDSINEIIKALEEISNHNNIKANDIKKSIEDCLNDNNPITKLFGIFNKYIVELSKNKKFMNENSKQKNIITTEHKEKIKTPKQIIRQNPTSKSSNDKKISSKSINNKKEEKHAHTSSNEFDDDNKSIKSLIHKKIKDEVQRRNNDYDSDYNADNNNNDSESMKNSSETSQPRKTRKKQQINLDQSELLPDEQNQHSTSEQKIEEEEEELTSSSDKRTNYNNNEESDPEKVNLPTPPKLNYSEYVKKQKIFNNNSETMSKMNNQNQLSSEYSYEEESSEQSNRRRIYQSTRKQQQTDSDTGSFEIKNNESTLQSIDDGLTISESNLRKERKKNSTENKEKTEDVSWTTPITIDSITQTFFPKPETQTPLQNQTENETENQINSHLVRKEKWKELSKKLRRHLWSAFGKTNTSQSNLHTLYHVYTCVNRLNKLKECRKLTKEMEEEIEQIRKNNSQQQKQQQQYTKVKSNKKNQPISTEEIEELLNKTINKYNGKNNNVFDTENNLTSSTKNNINVNDNNTINDVDIGIKKLEQLIKTKESIYDKFKIDYTEKTIKQLDEKTLINTLKNENYLHETLLGGDGFGFRGKFTKNTFSIGLREGGFAMEQLMTLGIEQNKEMGPIFEALKNGKCIKIETEDEISKEEMAKLTASLKIGNLKAMFNLLNRAKKIYVKEQQCDISIIGKPIQKMLTSVFKLKKAQININYYINEIKAKRNNEITATTKIAETLHKIYNDICSNSTISSKIFENVISINNNENNYVNLVYAVDLIKTVTKNIYRNKADFIGIINSLHQDPLVTVQRLLETAHLEKISRLNKNDEIVEQTESEHEIYNDSVGLQ